MLKSGLLWLGLMMALTNAHRVGADTAPAASPIGREPAALPAQHWSLLPVKPSPVPQPRNQRWPQNDIDRFVLARLEAEGLRPSVSADSLTWLRRVCLDLTGLPPTRDQSTAWRREDSAEARVRLVDALLESPRYGERWAQHWLDVVRYADTHGFEVNTERPNAWPYRDYVIRAFNRDLPYDQFVREQLAGDSLGEDAATGFLITASVLLPGQIGQDEPSKRLARQDALDEIVVNVSQTFLGLSVGCARCHDHKFDPISARDYYAMQAFIAGVEYDDRELRTPETELLRRELGHLKIQRAAADRKLAQFEPIARPKTPPPPELDAHLHGSTPLSGVGPKDQTPRRPGVTARLNTERFAPTKARRVRFTIKETNNLEPCVDEFEVLDLTGANVALARAGTTVQSSGDTVVADRHELRQINDGRYGNSRSWMSNEKGRGWVVFTFAEERVIDRITWSRDREGQFSDRLATRYVIEVSGDPSDADAGTRWEIVADDSDRAKPASAAPAPEYFPANLDQDQVEQMTRLRQERKLLESKIELAERGQMVFAGKFRAPDRIRLLRRGDPEQPQDDVAPAIPRALDARPLSVGPSEQDRRRTLADWIAQAQNPLTARVMVNRIWQGHFGTGLVETPSDFGRNGALPSHPELLDWLATEFIRSGWSIKHLHRLIVLSATFAQSASIDPAAAARDADVRLLWRFPARRLEAEIIRDAMLAVSGQLNTNMYGRGFDLFEQRGGLSGFKPVESYRGEGLRRMIYAHKVRREREAIFGAFDCPDAGQSTARRRESTTSLQALNLFNSRFTLDQADAFSARVLREVGADNTAAAVRRAYQSALGREPSRVEQAEAEQVVQAHGLATLGRVLFNCNEFLFLP